MPDVSVPGGASAPELRAHLAVPPVGEGPWPAVVVVHELLGLNDDTREQAARMAAAGFLDVAPDLFPQRPGAVPAVDVRRPDARGRPGLRRPGGHPIVAGRPAGLHRADRRRRLLHGRGLRAPRRDPGLRRRRAQLRAPAAPGARRSCAGPARWSAATDGGTSRCAVRPARLTGALDRAGRAARREGVPGRRALVHEPAHSGPIAALEKVLGVGYHEPSAQDAWARILRLLRRAPAGRRPPGLTDAQRRRPAPGATGSGHAAVTAAAWCVERRKRSSSPSGSAAVRTSA